MHRDFNRAMVSRHLLLMAAFVTLAAAAMAYPFLPGSHDPAAIPWSAVAQVFVGGSLLLFPVGALWLVYEVHQHRQRKRGISPGRGRHGFALVSLALFGLVAAIATLAASFTAGFSLSVPLAGAAVFLGAGMWRRVRGLKTASPSGIHPAPLWMTLPALALTVIQLCAARPLADYSRQRAITQSAEMIQAIEQCHGRQGRYPVSLEAVWSDYSPSVVGVERYRYAPHGESYLLIFEQPRFLFDDFGVREFVVYNHHDNHRIISHDSWILLLSPEEAERNQGWHAARPTGNPHWKSFLFD